MKRSRLLTVTVPDGFPELAPNSPEWICEAHRRYIDVFLDGLEMAHTDHEARAKLQRREARRRHHLQDLMENSEFWARAFDQGRIIDRTILQLFGFPLPTDGASVRRLFHERGITGGEFLQLLRETIKAERNPSA